MTTKSPSNEGGSNSGVPDIKYQKAIKEISKLISLNTTLKNDVTKIQQKYDKLQAEYDVLEAKYNNLKGQSKINADMTMEMLPIAKLSQKISSRVFEDDSGDITELLEKNKKINQLQEKLKEKEEKINKLRREVEQKNKEIQDQRNKNLNLQHQITNLQSIRNLKIAEASEKQNLRLKKELENSENWVKKISSDFQNLKKQISAGSKSFTNTNSIQINTQIQTSQDILTQFYAQRLKKSEIVNLKLKKQFNHKKEKLKSQIDKLNQERQDHMKKIINLSGFLEKQQAFIEKFLIRQKEQSVETC